MKSLKQLMGAALVAALTIHASMVTAQAATGSSATTCTQSGSTVTCTTSTSFNLPADVNLQNQTGGSAFTLAAGVVTPVALSGCTVTPANQTVNIGASPSLSVSCLTGSATAYQWLKNGSTVGGATGQTYTLSPNTDTATVNSAYYQVQVTNSVNSILSAQATINVTSVAVVAPSSCSISPPSISVSVGGSTTLNATCGAGSAPFGYAWYKNNAPISGATSSSYTVSASDTSTAGAQTYRVDITNSGGSSSASSTVTANPAAACSSSGSFNSTIDANSGYTQVGSGNLFGTANTYTIRIVVGASSSTVGGWAVLLSHTEGVASQRAFRTVVLSPCSGDFSSSAAVVLSNNAIGGSSELALNDPGRGVPNLTTGTWYINIKNTYCTANTRCDVLVDWLHY